MRLDTGQIEVVDPQVADVLRKMTGAKRLAIANGMFVSARNMLISHLRTLHPDWGDTRIVAEAASRLSHGAV